MEKLVIEGGIPLKGNVEIIGAKNSAVALLPATLLINGIATINNLPNISDIKISCEILEGLGSKIKWNNSHSVTIDNRNIKNTTAPIDLTSKFRASYYLIGAMLGRLGKIEVGLPGGCNLGPRPIDQHIKGFEALGASIDLSQGKIMVQANKLEGTTIYLDIVSVGATINIMLAAVLSNGTTFIENAAKEPHVVDIANFLNSMGANIKGAGTDIIRIKGVKKLHGTNYSVIPDQIEAGTYMVLATITRGDITIKNIIPKHLESISAKLSDVGNQVIIYDEAIRVIGSDTILPTSIKTMPYPGFPTDMQPQFSCALALANGVSKIEESIFENRFKYVDEIVKMGADIKIDKSTLIINGVSELKCKNVIAPDLRAGAALVLACLATKGKSEIDKIEFVERGYEDFVNKLKDLGADIKKIEE